ncbi:Ribosomal RNA small subunit methyltransferase D [Anaerolineae bacterium]|nr:Ribosomal RNA small subunit methyltransferase D [Anaerolineae bacterium]
MRVISGTAKGRTLKSPGEATRPITDRVKTSLFNILAAHVRDANVLDLFAGAGSVGIEALSRGARAATFVELDGQALRAIRANLELTRLEAHAKIVRLDVFKFIRSFPVIASREAAKQSPIRPLEIASSQRSLLAMTRFDLIYIAPPQYKELWAETLKALDTRDLLAADGIIVAQIHPKEYKELELTQFELYDQRKYGSTMLCFYQVRPANESPAE